MRRNLEHQLIINNKRRNMEHQHKTKEECLEWLGELKRYGDTGFLFYELRQECPCIRAVNELYWEECCHNCGEGQHSISCRRCLGCGWVVKDMHLEDLLVIAMNHGFRPYIHVTGPDEWDVVFESSGGIFSEAVGKIGSTFMQTVIIALCKAVEATKEQHGKELD